MPEDWSKNKEKLTEYHDVRRAYYEKRAPEFLARARILMRDGDPDLN